MEELLMTYEEKNGEVFKKIWMTNLEQLEQVELIQEC